VTLRTLLLVTAALFFAGSAEPPRAPFTRALLGVAADSGYYPGEPESWTLAELSRIARLVRARAAGGRSRVAALNETVFGALGFVREVGNPDLGFVFLPTVLERRRGGCVGLGTLYIALGELLGWRVEGVLRPGHFFVQVEDRGVRHNVELLRRGEEMPDSWYGERFPVPGPGAPEYGKPLTPKEVLAVVEYDVGNERRKAGRLSEARRAYALAGRLFPEFAEAHASLGATLHLLGGLDGALQSYRAARQQNPDLPGVEHNIELLRAEPHEPARFGMP
jgi:regulator of sirC expression with transglutaminase-like and TPR domain